MCRRSTGCCRMAASRWSIAVSIRRRTRGTMQEAWSASKGRGTSAVWRCRFSGSFMARTMSWCSTRTIATRWWRGRIVIICGYSRASRSSIAPRSTPWSSAQKAGALRAMHCFTSIRRRACSDYGDTVIARFYDERDFDGAAVNLERARDLARCAEVGRDARRVLAGFGAVDFGRRGTCRWLGLARAMVSLSQDLYRQDHLLLGRRGVSAGLALHDVAD